MSSFRIFIRPSLSDSDLVTHHLLLVQVLLWEKIRNFCIKKFTSEEAADVCIISN